jgi:predicted RNase H-like nuclease (RuvC/YqgF family)
MDELFKLITPIISGAALSWGIYSFILKRRDDKAAKDRHDYEYTVQKTREYLEKEIYSLKTDLLRQKDEFEKMKLAAMETNTRSVTQGEMIKFSLASLEKTIEKHDTKLENFGKVIIK